MNGQSLRSDPDKSGPTPTLWEGYLCGAGMPRLRGLDLPRPCERGIPTPINQAITREALFCTISDTQHLTEEINTTAESDRNPAPLILRTRNVNHVAIRIRDLERSGRWFFPIDQIALFDIIT